MECLHCGASIKENVTRNIRGCRMAAFPSSPCSECGLLHWKDDGTPVQCHSDDNPVLAYAVGEKDHEFREAPSDFIEKVA